MCFEKIDSIYKIINTFFNNYSTKIKKALKRLFINTLRV